MKAIITILFSTLLFSTAFADVNASGSATQTIQLTLAPVIQIAAGNLQVNASTQEFTINSNKGFTITANTVTANQNVVLALVNNQTEGKAVNTGNIALSATAKNLLTNCNRGNDQTFAVNYKSKSNARVVYTATQP